MPTEFQQKGSAGAGKGAAEGGDAGSGLGHVAFRFVVVVFSAAAAAQGVPHVTGQ
jgi:hypothetical protein